ncbi:MAG: hypothetical protein HC811_06585 [Flammeovirgaceae bacterium]|nr:hypothetical protein [Flammeovirgaceae bacterium]
MEKFGPYTLIIAASVIILLSFFFITIAKKTKIPSVLLLIFLGVGLQYLLRYLGVVDIDFFSLLEVLGIVGLIMIVLEASLDLKLQRHKLGTIIRSFMMALIGLGFSTMAAAAIIFYLIPGMSWAQSFLYATPLSILSSAIIIPSVGHLIEKKREFHIYESTFSDILGIMLFYFLIGYFESGEITLQGEVPQTGNHAAVFIINLVITVGISLIASYTILFVFQRIEQKTKFFVLIAVLLLLYAIAKEFHLSPLILILVFGLMVSNSNLFFRGPFRKMLDPEKFKDVEHGLHGLTAEAAFIVRTFFFVIFGASILLTSLISFEVLEVSIALIASIFIIRIVLMRFFIGKNIKPQIWIAPRGLITILLFYAIPIGFQTELFNPGILLFIIIATGIVMTFGLISHRIEKDAKPDSEPTATLLTGTAYTVTIDPHESRLGRWIKSMKYYEEGSSWLRRLFLATTRALGIQPYLSGETKIFGKRLQAVINIIRNPENVSLKDNSDYQDLKKYIHRIIFRTDTLEGLIFDIFILLLIIISVAIVMIQSISGISPVFRGILFALEWIITIIFTIEYALRIWTSYKPKKYIYSFYGIVDLLAILPLFLELLFQDIYSLGIIRLLRLLRIFRILKLVRFMGEANVLLRGLKASSAKIMVFLFFVIIVCTILGSVMFVIEGPEHGFTSIPKGVYWAVVTLTTVGYGDISPSTPLGQFIAMALMILGYGVIAVPTGLMAAGVAASVSRKSLKTQTCPRCADSNQSQSSNYCSVCGERMTKINTEGNNDPNPQSHEQPS